jgi:hypothetical protein
VKTLVRSLIPCVVVVGLVFAECALLVPTMEYLRPGKLGSWSLGLILAVMIPSAEVTVGFLRANLRAAGKTTAELTVLMIGLAFAQSAYTYLSEHASVYSVTMAVTHEEVQKDGAEVHALREGEAAGEHERLSHQAMG